jgi:polyisoprenoid-binding protein YceI
MTSNTATTQSDAQDHEAPLPQRRRLLVGDQSTVGFRVRKMGMYDVKGRFDGIEGHVAVAGDGTPLGGAAVIDAATVNTRVPPRDRHVRSRDFLGVSEHPRISVAVDQVVPHEDGSFAFPATLALHGVERRVDLSGHLHGAPSEDGVAVLHLSGTIDRRDFGIRARRPFEWIVAREVRLDADLVLSATG